MPLFPLVVWVGILGAALLMVAAGIAVLGKMPAKQKFNLHRNIARVALTVMLVHVVWSLLRYLP